MTVALYFEGKRTNSNRIIMAATMTNTTISIIYRYFFFNQNVDGFSTIGTSSSSTFHNSTGQTANNLLDLITVAATMTKNDNPHD